MQNLATSTLRRTTTDLTLEGSDVQRRHINASGKRSKERCLQREFARLRHSPTNVLVTQDEHLVGRPIGMDVDPISINDFTDQNTSNKGFGKWHVDLTDVETFDDVDAEFQEA